MTDATHGGGSQSSTDVITYAGSINFDGYKLVCEVLANRKSSSVLIVMATPGGDPHAGFRIARALQHTYEMVHALVPRYCKSAGTLVVLGASRLYMDDMSELGPLDIQVKKDHEIVGRNSGLDIIQAVNYLQMQAMSAFRGYLVELTRDAGLSTRTASDIASNLTAGLFQPISAQVDPMKLAEMQRATEIAFEYGARLAEKSGNLRANGIARLVTGYPSHGFVIDRKEARTIFISVDKPVGVVAQLSSALKDQMEPHTSAVTPVVTLYTLQFSLKEQTDDSAQDAGSCSAGTEASGAQDDGDRQAAADAASSPTPDTPDAA